MASALFEVKDPTIPLVLLEDISALTGLTIASERPSHRLTEQTLFTEYRPLLPTTPFFGSNEPGQWRSGTAMSFQTLAVTKPFLVNSVTQFRPGPPPPMQSMTWVRQWSRCAWGPCAAGEHDHAAPVRRGVIASVPLFGSARSG